MTEGAATGRSVSGGAATDVERRVLPDADAAAVEAARELADILIAAVAARGRADWATAAGSASIPIYRALTEPPLREVVPWPRIHTWWGDDRYVPREHALSNIKPVDQVLLNTAARSGQSGFGEDAHDVRHGFDSGVVIPLANVHPMPLAQAIGGARGAEWAAATYENELRASDLETRDGWPVFDVLLLGVGPDGHVLSVFPDSAALDDDRRWVLPIPAPTHVEPHVERVTLNPRVLAVARRLLIVSTGESKAEILATVIGGDRDPRRWPAQLALRPGATWLLDTASAAKLPG